MSGVLSVLLVLVVGLSPFWLGSNRPLPWAAHAVLFGLILAMTALAVIVEGRRYPALKAGPVLWPLALVVTGLAWAVIQLLPVQQLLSIHPTWTVAGVALDREHYGTISINPAETRWALLNWASAGAVLLSSYCLARRPENAALMLRLLLGLACLAGLYGLVRLSLSLDKILWFDEPDAGYLTSGFINRNSAATFFGMAAVAALGLLLVQARRVLERGREMSGRGKIIAWANSVAGYLGLDTVVFVLLFVCLLATGSRGGILFSAAAMMVLLFLYGLRMRGGRSVSAAGWTLIMLISSILILSLVELSGFRFMGRLLDEGLDSAARLETYRRTLVAIGDYAWLGSGLGTFQDVFPAYRLEIAPGRYVWTDAHNDYLELALGLGMPAASLVLLGLVLVAWKLLRGFFTRRRNAHYAAIAFCACLLAGLHSLVDFSLQIQANTFVFALLLGLGLAQSVSSRDSQG